MPTGSAVPSSTLPAATDGVTRLWKQLAWIGCPVHVQSPVRKRSQQGELIQHKWSPSLRSACLLPATTGDAEIAFLFEYRRVGGCRGSFPRTAAMAIMVTPMSVRWWMPIWMRRRVATRPNFCAHAYQSAEEGDQVKINICKIPTQFSEKRTDVYRPR